MNRSSPFLRWRSLALLMFLPLITGCLVIEKKTLVLMIPEKSKEVHLYYVFEGLSVLRHNKSTLEKAVANRRTLEANRLNFFIGGTELDSPLLKFVRFEDLNYYLDPNRERKLCAERRVTITDRTKFVKELNQLLSDYLNTRSDIELQVDHFRLSIRSAIKDREQNKQGPSDELSFGALTETFYAMNLLLNELDDESLKRVLVAAQERTDWIRLDNGTIQILLPATPECAQKICSGEFAKKWPKELKSFVSPLELKATKEGILIVIGKKGQPIQFQFTDTREYQKELEPQLIQSVGKVDPILINDKPANGKQLIERCIEETNQPKKK
jgi:hypothetical protein